MLTFQRAVIPVTVTICGLGLAAAAVTTPALATTAHGGTAASAAHGIADRAPGPATAGCTGPFVKVASPTPGSSDNILYATAATGPHDMWAVGRQYSGSDYQNLILFNGGSGWSQVPAPGPGFDFSELTAVSTSGPSDAWAAGFNDTGDPDTSEAAQVMHWDGTSWTSAPLPALPGALNEDSGPGIVDISPTDAWLAGGWESGDTSGSFLAHWNGTAWSLVSHPHAVAFSSIAAQNAHDIWAVGTGTGSSFPAVIEHYDGSKWTTSATLAGLQLSSITSVSATQAWAVGSGSDGDTTATVEWNGSAWNTVPSPNPSSSDWLTSVSSVAGGGAWAVGNEIDRGSGVGEYQPMAMHWDGTAWTAVPAIGVAPAIFGSTGAFFGVVALTDSRASVVGYGSSQQDSLVANLCPFAVQDTGFAPATARISGPGAAAYWVVPASDATGHELADGSGFGLFDSGVKAPGSSYAFTFRASGTYIVKDLSDGATGKVGVPILAAQVPGQRPVLWWASTPAPAGAHFEVQVMAPGSTTFTRFKNTTATRQYVGLRWPAGTYEFRSRMRNPATGVTTGWSPALTVTVP